ncbi:MAG: Lsr2 family protein [Actinomycetota bacterium]|nr:Lsr2 family protein [Actinomycetota bacterium]
MAQKTIVQLFDDLDGTTGDDIVTTQFSLDGIEYDIDLNESNATRLRDELADFVASARRTGGRVKRTTARTAGEGRSKDETKAIRDWARENGHDISERGRIPAAIIEAHQASQTVVEAPPAKAVKGAKGGKKPKLASFSG